MKKTLLGAALCAALTLGTLSGTSSCSSSNNGGGTGGGSGGGSGGGISGQVIDVTADITADTTWTTGNTYNLKQHVYVGDGNPASQVVTLTVQPGVIVTGTSGTSLVVTRSGRLDAVGTVSAPIVFTSGKPVGDRDRGDWGGVVLLGRAPVNFAGNADAGTASGEGFIEGFPASGTKTVYGSNAPDTAWSCGTLKYARIEFAGYRLAPNNELNSLTMGGCGSGTTIDFVQVHYGLDDGIEVFGGTVEIKHAVISRMEDDMFDWDNGWSGRAQFIVGFQEPSHGASGIEADNDATGSSNTPRTNPEVWNVTLIGRPLTPPATEDGNNNRGIHLRRNTNARIGNAIVEGFGSIGLQVESNGTAASLAPTGDGYVKNSVFWKNPMSGMTNDLVALPDGGMANADLRPDGGTFDNLFDESGLMSLNGNIDTDPHLPFPANLTSPVLKPSMPLSGATPPAGFDTSANYMGAIGDTDWTVGWTAYPVN